MDTVVRLEIRIPRTDFVRPPAGKRPDIDSRDLIQSAWECAGVRQSSGFFFGFWFCTAGYPGSYPSVRLSNSSRSAFGTVSNFDYSDANKNSGIVWNEATFKEYIKAPAAIPDNALGTLYFTN